MLRAGTAQMHEEIVFITVDHKVHNEENESRMQHRHAVVVKDFCSHRIQSVPMKNKTAQETMQSFQKIVPQDERPGIIHTDNSLEQANSIPIRNQRNCRKRRSRRQRMYFSFSGPVGSWQKMAGRSCEMLLLFAKHTRQTGRQKVPVEGRFGNPFVGPVIPCLAEIVFYQIF